MSAPLSYWLKKLLVLPFYPLPLALGLLVAGGFLVLLRRRRLGFLLQASGLAVMLVFGLPPVPLALTRYLEQDVAPVTEVTRILPEGQAGRQNENGIGQHGVVWVVVLGTGMNPNPDYPATLQVSSGFWMRLSEGIRLYRQLPTGRLLISVAGKATLEEKKAFGRAVCEFFALAEEDVDLITDAWTTNDEAARAAAVVGDSLCIVVSEAMHLPRAMTLFENRDVQALPAPSGYAAPENVHSNVSILSFVPSAGNLSASRRAIHEILGRAWARMSGERRAESGEDAGFSEI